MMTNLMSWSIDRNNTDAHRNHVINHMKRKYGDDLEHYLPPLFFKDIQKLTDDEIRLLDNFTYLFSKGEECGCSIFR